MNPIVESTFRPLAHLLRQRTTLLAVALVALFLSIASGSIAGTTDTVYAIGFSTNSIYSVDLVNGTATQIYANYPIAPAAQNSAAFAQRASDGMLFYISGTAGNGAVYRWNPATPATAPVFLGRTGAGTPYMPRLAFASDGTLYAVNTNGTQLYTINTTTGLASTAGAPLTGGPSGGGDIAFDSSGTLYLASGADIYTVPLAGGAVSLVGTSTGFAGTAVGAAFDPFTGNLLVANNANPAQLYSVNLGTLVATPYSGTMSVGMGDLAAVSNREADLSATITDGAASAIPGSGVSYTATITNSGPSDETGATVADTVPASVTGVSWTCSITSGSGSCGAASGSGNSISTTVDLTSGSIATYTITGTIDPSATGTLDDTIAVGAPAVPTDPNPGNDSATDSDTLTPQADLSIVQVDSPDPVTVGGALAYTLSVTNAGPSEASSLTVTDTLPAGVGYVSASGSGWSCSQAAGTVTCTRASLAVTLAPDITVNVTAPGASGTITNQAAVSAATTDPVGANDTSSEDTTVTPPPNNPPVAADDSASTTANTPVTVDALTNDSDPDSDPLTISSNSQPTNGSSTCSATQCTYTPSSGYTGPDSFSYTIDDGNGGTDTATINLTVTPPPNNPPVAADDSASTTANTPVTVDALTNDSDPDSDPLTISSNSQPTNGSSTCSATQCTYTPSSGYTGPDSFSYTIDDGNGGTDTATINLTVTPPPNNPPVAADDSASTTANTPVTVDALTNDSDPDSDPLTISSNSQPTNGSSTCSATQCTYTPSSGYTGPDSFSYTIDDGNGGTDTATINLTVTPPPNNPPVAADDSASTTANTPVTVDALTNDSDPDSDPLTISSNSQPTNGSSTCSATQCTYTPSSGYTGPDSFSYTIDDGNGGTDTATINLTVTPPPNNPPVAADDSASTTANTPVTVDALTNDSDPDSDPLTISSNSQPTNGSSTCSATQCTYTPSSGYTGPDSFSYTIDDGNGGTDTATINLTVTPPPNNPPVAADDSASTTANTPVTVDALTNDSDPDSDPLTISSNSQPTNGSSTCSATQCTYTPSSGYTGPDSFSYTIDDGNGGTDTATINLTVTPPPNNPPVAADDSASTTANTPVTVDALTNDSDPDSDPLTISSNSQPTNGSSTCSATQCTYTPSSGYTGPDSFSYTIDDGNGGTDTATINLTVTPPPNNPPVAADDSASTTANTPVTVDALTNDSDPDSDPLTISSNSQPTNGSSTCSATQCTYTPSSGYTGPDSFSYTIDDGNGGTDTATINLTVTPPPNNPPVAADDSASTTANTPVTVDALTNDSDPDSDPLTISSNSQPTNGSSTCSATQCTYTPSSGYTGPDSFSYTIDDGNGGTDTATINLTVTPPPNNPPVAADDSASTTANTPVTVDALTNDSDPDSDPLTISSNSQPTNGSSTCSATQCTYTPSSGYTGPDSFSYTIDDGNGGTDTATINLTVTAAATAPPPATTTPTSPAPSSAPPKADLVVRMKGPAQAAIGDKVSFTWTVSNQGPDPAQGVLVTNTLPSDLALVAGSLTVDSAPAGSKCSVGGTLLNCQLGSLAVGGVIHLALDARIVRAPTGKVTDQASAVSTTSDPDGTNNADSATVVIPGQPKPKPTQLVHAPLRRQSGTPRLTIGTKAMSSIVRPGKTVRYRITVRNVGTASAVNVHVCDLPNSKSVFVSAPGAAFSKGRACWSIGQLARNARRFFFVVVRLDTSARKGKLPNVAVTHAANAPAQVRAHRTVGIKGAVASRSKPRPGGVTG